jgi:hypothetical protein
LTLGSKSQTAKMIGPALAPSKKSAATNSNQFQLKDENGPDEVLG